MLAPSRNLLQPSGGRNRASPLGSTGKMSVPERVPEKKMLKMKIDPTICMKTKSRANERRTKA
jgi:hypothetical protein